MARVVTLEKIDDRAKKSDFKTIVEALTKDEDVSPYLAEHLTGLTMDANLEDKRPKKLKNTLRVIRNFELGDKNYTLHLNKQDEKVSDEKNMILNMGGELIVRYGDLKSIPKEILIARNFGRIRRGKNYVIYRKLEHDSGIVVVDETISETAERAET